jgi:hypothetical protein
LTSFNKPTINKKNKQSQHAKHQNAQQNTRIKFQINKSKYLDHHVLFSPPVRTGGTGEAPVCGPPALASLPPGAPSAPLRACGPHIGQKKAPKDFLEGKIDDAVDCNLGPASASRTNLEDSNTIMVRTLIKWIFSA